MAVSRPSPQRAADAVLLGAVLLAALALLSQLLLYGYGRDQGIYDVVGRTILSGGAPYRDAWDFKPPGVYFVYAAARLAFGAEAAAIRVLEAAALLSLFVAFPILSRRFVGSARAGWLAALVSVLAYVPFEYWDTAQPEGFGGVLLVWALVCTSAPASATPRGRAARLALAGALYGLAGLMKPPLAGGAAVSFGFLLRERMARVPSSRPLREGLATALPLALGAAAVLAATLGWYASRGALGDLREALFVFAPRYTALGLGRGGLVEHVGRALREWLFGYAPWTLPGLLGLALLPPLARREREGVLHVLGVGAVVVLGVAIQAKFFVYHYAAAVLLTGLPAGWGYWKVWERARGSLRASALALATLAALALVGLPGSPHLATFGRRSLVRVATGGGSHWEAAADVLHSSGDVDAGALRRAASWLRENTPPDSSLYVWGFHPILYSQTGRRPASRYIYNVPQRAAWSRREARRRLMDDLSRDPPTAIVVARGDALPWVTGSPGDSASELDGFAPLRRLIAAEYEEVERFENLTVYKRAEP
jgi:hypothetical protein